MIAAVDVHYSTQRTRAAAIVFSDWSDSIVIREETINLPAEQTAGYVPGEFYKRELGPALLVLNQIGLSDVTTIIIDGYVWLAPNRPGLGSYVHNQVSPISVIGVAKRNFQGNTAVTITRGISKKPLWITAEGIDSNTAAVQIQRMHGDNRIPFMLKMVDQISRAEHDR
jgi:deoxyribonuclease V